MKAELALATIIVLALVVSLYVMSYRRTLNLLEQRRLRLREERRLEGR